MNPLELKVARIRRKISGKDAGAALGLTVDGYFKKEHGDARLTLSDAFTITKLFQLSLEEFTTIFLMVSYSFYKIATEIINSEILHFL